MAESRRASRMKRHHRRATRGSLNMVSLMDIFTILVFFLLFSSTEVEVLPTPRDMTLPESVAEEGGRESLVVAVTAEAVMLRGEVVARIDEILASEGTTIPGLAAALADPAIADAASQLPPEAREVTIMGDRGLPFTVLRRVMATCSAADYGRIALAVRQRGGELAAADAPVGPGAG